jgi:cytochrome c peroxidase
MRLGSYGTAGCVLHQLVWPDVTFSPLFDYRPGCADLHVGHPPDQGLVDHGLLANPAVDDPEQADRFKVLTLRNVAVTGPYMHNGVFDDPRTVVLFDNKYNSRSARRQINPETGQRWADPEVPANLSEQHLLD